MDELIPLAATIGPFAVACLIVTLIFLVIRMKHDRRLREMSLQGLGQEEQRALADMGDIARRMEQRVENLERILDSEVAGWRSRLPL